MIFLVVEEIGCAHLLDQPSSTAGNILEPSVILDEHHKLVASHTGQGVAVAGLGVQTVGYLAQQDISDFVAQRVIDDLETIQVHQQDRQLRPGATMPAQSLCEALIKQKSVR